MINTVSGQVTRFWFDADGNRVRRTDTAATWLYVGQYFEIVTSTNQQVSYYLFGSQRVAVRQKAPNSGVDPGPVYWLHGDHLGSASMATSITGAKVSESRYKPFGETRWVTGTLAMPTDKTFTGQRAEPALGSLMDYGARFYSPVLGRFLSADTIVPEPGDPQSLNRYAYVRNNPLTRIDPTGRGEFDERALDRLAGMGEWMKRHSRSIYGCTQAPPEFKAPPDCRLIYNPTTNRMYVHVFAWPYIHLHLDGFAGKVEYAQLLNDASEVGMTGLEPWQAAHWADQFKDSLTLNLPVQKPNVTVPVIELFMK